MMKLNTKGLYVYTLLSFTVLLLPLYSFCRTPCVATQQIGNIVFTCDNAVFVKDFGALPDDAKNDTERISRAIRYANANNKPYVVFDKGVYNLKGANGGAPTIYINGVNDIKLIGQVTEDGQPATILEVNAPLANNDSIAFSRHIDCRNSESIGVENIIFDLNPRFSTSGRVVAIDEANKTVEVEILEGMSHFEGMQCFSANAWDLSTKKLLHVDALTINMHEPYFANLWQRVDRPGKVVYAIKDMPFYNKVNVGDGMSWHYAAETVSGITIYFYNCKDLKMTNLHIYNSITQSVVVVDTKDITIKKVRIMPQGNSLAVGSRDGFYLSNPRGVLEVDDVYVKGVRWDPLVSRINFVGVKEIEGDSTIITSYTANGNVETMFQVGDQVVFWCSDIPVKRQIESVTILSSQGEKSHRIKFSEPLPAEAIVGTYVTPPTWDSAVIKNSVFEDNFGGLVYQNENLLLENNTFRNNAYHAVGFGTVSLNTGAFAENIVVRNNHFISNGWINKYAGIYGGGITTLKQHPAFSVEPYNMNILIENNTFEDMSFNSNMGAIGIKNAQDVTIRNNTYNNVQNKVIIEPQSTRNIVNEDGN